MDVKYNREILLEVLGLHHETHNNGCSCGWRETGRTYAEHVAAVYVISVGIRDNGREEEPEYKTNQFRAGVIFTDTDNNPHSHVREEWTDRNKRRHVRTVDTKNCPTCEGASYALQDL